MPTRQREAHGHGQPRRRTPGQVHGADHDAQHRLAEHDDGEQPQPLRQVARMRPPAPETGRASSGTSSSSATALTYSHGRHVSGTRPCAPQARADSANAASSSPLKRRAAGTRTNALQVEQHQARPRLGAGKGRPVRIHPRLHEHRRPRQHEHQQQREDGLHRAAVVEAGSIRSCDRPTPGTAARTAPPPGPARAGRGGPPGDG